MSCLHFAECVVTTIRGSHPSLTSSWRASCGRQPWSIFPADLFSQSANVTTVAAALLGPLSRAGDSQSIKQSTVNQHSAVVTQQKKQPGGDQFCFRGFSSHRILSFPSQETGRRSARSKIHSHQTASRRACRREKELGLSTLAPANPILTPSSPNFMTE